MSNPPSDPDLDPDARSSCLRAVRLIARAARLCATIEPVADQYRISVEGAERMIERAQKYYETMKGEHAPHERIVRFVGTAVVEARAVVTALQAGLADGEDLERLAGKVERAIVRAGGDL